MCNLELVFKRALCSVVLCFFTALMAGCGGGGGSTPMPAPAAPTGVEAVPFNGRVELSWQNVPQASSFDVYVAAESFMGDINGYATLAEGDLIPDVQSLSTTITGLTNDQTYYFVVVALNEGGESAPSAEVTAVPFIPDMLTGPIDSLPQSTTVHIWGDIDNQLCTIWSVGVFDLSGHFYNGGGVNVTTELYVLPAPADPLQVLDATLFDYTDDFSVHASEGDTVFFKGLNGYYGAWHIIDIEGDNTNATFTGRWYFVTTPDNGDFTGRALETPDQFETLVTSVCPDIRILALTFLGNTFGRCRYRQCPQNWLKHWAGCIPMPIKRRRKNLMVAVAPVAIAVSEPAIDPQKGTQVIGLSAFSLPESI